MIYDKYTTKKFRKFVEYTDDDSIKDTYTNYSINKITWCLNNHKWEEIDTNLINSCGGCNTILKLNKMNMLYYYIILYCLTEKDNHNILTKYKNINRYELTNIELKIRRLLDNNNKNFMSLLNLIKLLEFNHTKVLNNYIEYLVNEGYYNV